MIIITNNTLTQDMAEKARQKVGNLSVREAMKDFEAFRGHPKFDPTSTYGILEPDDELVDGDITAHEDFASMKKEVFFWHKEKPSFIWSNLAKNYRAVFRKIT